MHGCLNKRCSTAGSLRLVSSEGNTLRLHILRGRAFALSFNISTIQVTRYIRFHIDGPFMFRIIARSLFGPV